MAMGDLSSLVNDMALDELDSRKLHKYAEIFNPRTRRMLDKLEI
jgi:hypothetical protein